MAQSVMQHSFHAGEFAPALNARVDVAKYKSAAALMRNFYPDYRGGASSRPGTAYCLQCYKSATQVRLIPFQANFVVNFVLEFGENYIRPFFNGAPITETAVAITGATATNPLTIQTTALYNVGDWILLQNVEGMTQVNGRYFIVIGTVPGGYTLGNLDSTPVNATGFSPYVSGGTAGRVYVIQTPYLGTDLNLIKFAQNINTLILCHPAYAPRILTIISPANWTLVPLVFGSTVGTPTSVSVSTTLAAGSVSYSYEVTAVDQSGQESGPSVPGGLSGVQDIRGVAGTNVISWSAVPGAVSYNVYRAQVSYSIVPAGSEYGFIGSSTGTVFTDTNIGPDFSVSPPIVANPFLGSAVQSVVLDAGGSYSSIPTMSIAPPGTAGGVQATAQAIMGVLGLTNMGSFGAVSVIAGQTYNMYQNLTPGPVAPTPGSLVICSVRIDALDSSAQPTAWTIVNRGAITSGVLPVHLTSNIPSVWLSADITSWTVTAANLISGGSGYTSVPAVAFSFGGAAAHAVITSPGGGGSGSPTPSNPAVPTYAQQRLILASPVNNPQQFNMSQPGAYFNFNKSDPVQADDAIEGTLVSSSLQSIKSMLGMSTGLVILTDKSAWLLNGGSPGSAITPSTLVANQHSYNGASDVPPIVSNFDILYVQSKGSVVRDLTYNFYAAIYTGTDISILSSHLFYGFTIKEWAFAEEPFKLIWAVRNDGILLSLTYLKEQDIVGWSHHDSPEANGRFHSVCCVTESRPTTDGRNQVNTVDATYFVVERTIDDIDVKFIERLAERNFIDPGTEEPTAKYAWCVDCGLQYAGEPVTAVQGLSHLVGENVYGLVDGKPVGPLIVLPNGIVNLPPGMIGSVITLGLPYVAQLQTLQLDVGEPTIQGKRKKITAVTVRCQETLDLQIGKTFDVMVPMKDLVLGNVGSATNQVVTDLVTADARTIIDPSWDVPGQYCIQQSQPLPATILGVIPEIVPGDTVVK